MERDTPIKEQLLKNALEAFVKEDEPRVVSNLIALFVVGIIENPHAQMPPSTMTFSLFS